MVSGNEFIDVIVGRDWLAARIQESVYALLVNNDKVPFTDAGITMVGTQVKNELALGVNQGYLTDDPAPEVILPKAADVPPSDKAARFLPNVQFTATLAGAIQKVQIQGYISV